MGKLANDAPGKVQIQGGFEYSNVSIDKLMATSYTLGTLVIDLTTSLNGRESDLHNIVCAIAKKLKDEDATANNILWRVVVFNSRIGVKELHGFKLLQDINPDDEYPMSAFTCDGMTNLYDAVGSTIEATLVEGKRLWDEELTVNAISVTITDGDENDSQKIRSASIIKEKTDIALRGEQVESYRSILVGVNPGIGSDWANHITKRLSEFQADAGLTEYIDIEEFDDSAVNKLILQISSITSDTSLKLGSGQSSKMTF